ncbi:MAG: methionine--tRNA ligase [archaeon]
MKQKYYITTAIDYVNGPPHIGHAFEKVIADALARWQKLQGKKVFFLTGTDENAQKNAQAAKAQNIPTQKLVDKNSKLFIELCEKLNISNDRFIRTTEAEHKKKAQELFKKAYDKGDIYKGKYEGYYCQGCEGFKTEKDLVEGKCPEHDEVKWLSEETYFFKLSKYKNQIQKFVKTYITPEKRKNEILSRLKHEELKDLSVTREKLDWGIDSPIDKNHKIYVWFDALINYISGANKNWPATVHIVGKDINWFHSVIWPGILLSTEQKLPQTLFVHGFLNLKGTKMSKSSGNIISPLELLEKYSPDTIRYSLLRCSALEDSDYSEEILLQRHNDELANKLGNLISRVSTLAEKYGLEKSKITVLDSGDTVEKVSKHIEKFELDKALNEVFAFIDKTNEFIQDKKPWEVRSPRGVDEERGSSSKSESNSRKTLYELSNAIKDFTILLSPFIPETCEKIAKTFNFELSWEELEKPLKVGKIRKSEILFKKI